MTKPMTTVFAGAAIVLLSLTTTTTADAQARRLAGHGVGAPRVGARPGIRVGAPGPGVVAGAHRAVAWSGAAGGPRTLTYAGVRYDFVTRPAGYYYNEHYGYWHPTYGWWNQAGSCWYDPDGNPPGAAGGPGTNWENPPGLAGGPGASPDHYGRCS